MIIADVEARWFIQDSEVRLQAGFVGGDEFRIEALAPWIHGAGIDAASLVAARDFGEQQHVVRDLVVQAERPGRGGGPGFGIAAAIYDARHQDCAIGAGGFIRQERAAKAFGAIPGVAIARREFQAVECVDHTAQIIGHLAINRFGAAGDLAHARHLRHEHDICAQALFADRAGAVSVCAENIVQVVVRRCALDLQFFRPGGCIVDGCALEWKRVIGREGRAVLIVRDVVLHAGVGRNVPQRHVRVDVPGEDIRDAAAFDAGERVSTEDDVARAARFLGVDGVCKGGAPRAEAEGGAAGSERSEQAFVIGFIIVAENKPCAMVGVARTIHHDVVFDRVRRAVRDADAACAIVPVVIILARDDILGEAVAVDGAAGQTDLQFIGNRQIDDAFEFHGVVIAEHALHVAFVFVGWALRLQQHCAACGVAAEQCALRAFQNLHVCKIEQHAGYALNGHRCRCGDGHFGEIGHNARRGIVGRALTPDGEGFRGARLAGRADRERGYAALQVLVCGDALLLQHVVTERRDGDRHILTAFFGAARRDDDVAEGCGSGGRGALFLRKG